MDDCPKYKHKARDNYSLLVENNDEVDEISAIVGAIIDGRHNMNLSQRDLAKSCGIPQSSVARIESGKTTPNLSTLIKILKQLDLKLIVTENED